MTCRALDSLQHRAVAHGMAHDQFYVDGLQHFVDDDAYSPRWNRNGKTSVATVGLVRLYNQFENSYCGQLPTPLPDCDTCPPTADPSALFLQLVGFYDVAEDELVFGITEEGEGRYYGYEGTNLGGEPLWEVDDGGGFVTRTLPFYLSNGYLLRATRSDTSAIGTLKVLGKNF